MVLIRNRYQTGPDADWAEAEKQVGRTAGSNRSGGPSTVSVKSGRADGKRKAGALDEAHKELAGGGGERKKGKKGR